MNFTGLLAFLVTVIHGHAAYFDSYDYCKLPCDNGVVKEKHIKCERKGCEVDKTYCKEFEPVEISDKFKQFILDEHNILRNKVASGKENLGANGPQPKASNMMTLKYNDELASVAQCVANTCQFEHSKCHRAKKLPWAGQNLAVRSSTNKSEFNDLENNTKSMILEWYEEVKLFNKDLIKPFSESPGAGHYTVMVWGDIQEIGCAFAKYKEDKEWHAILFVCNYGSTKEAGNLIGGEMYQVGKPCAACPKGTKCHSKYNALCGEDTLDLTEAVGKNKTRRGCIDQ